MKKRTAESYSIVFTKPKTVQLQKTQIPKPSPDEMLIQTTTTLISTGTELTVLSGKYPPESGWAKYGAFPFPAGYCNVGKVVEKGKNVKDIKIGDRIASALKHSQFATISQPSPYGVYNITGKIPDGVSDEEASFTVLAVGVMNSVRLTKVSLGESVGVVGLGLLGQFAIIWSKLCGAYPIIGVDISEKRLELAKICGADKVINSQKENVDEKIKLYSKNRMMDIVFEVTGNPEVIPWAIKLVKPQGRFILLSSSRGKTEFDFHDEINSPSRIVIGTHFGSHPQCETPYNPWTQARNRELFFDLILEKKIGVKHLISHVYSWKDAPDVYQNLLRDRSDAMGVLLKWSEE
jgi:2-desacetyl-2-hydroxyethyl bacteriochlorophyllide A dehydrogenase